MSTIDPRDLFISANPTGLSSAELAKDASGFVDDRTHADYLVFKAGLDAAQPAEQPQGEPVAYQIRSKTDRPESQWTPWRECCETTRAMHSHEVGRFNLHGIMREIRPVFTHADPGEAERLKQDLLVARAQGRAEVVEMIIALEAETGLDEFIGSHQIGCTGEWGSHWKEDELRQHFDVDPAAAGELERFRHSGYEIIQLEEERDTLRAQLAEWDALLREGLEEMCAMRDEIGYRGATLQVIKKIEAALYAIAEPSAPECGHPACVSLGEPHPFCEFVQGLEPSAPVERDVRAAFEAYCAKVGLPLDRLPSGEYLIPATRFVSQGWHAHARAALARKA